MEIGLMQLDEGTPVFYIDDTSVSWGRVFGSTYQKAAKKWLFPAFHPFFNRVVSDLKTVGGRFGEQAQNWLLADNLIKNPPINLTGNYAHQNEGLELLLKNYRYILNWEMGTGKSKVIVDLVYMLKELTLILCPLVGAKNWKNEFKKHVGNAVSCLPLNESRKQKLVGLKEAAEHDVIIVPFDTARLYGLPMLTLKAQKKITKSQFPVPKLDLDLVRQVNDADLQIKLIDDIMKGRDRASLREEVKELTVEPQWLCQLPYRIIVADESHRIKHLQSRRTKVCMRLAAQASRRYLLSGTLAQGDPRDLYPQLKFLAPYLIPEDYQAFQKKYVSFSPWNKHIVTGFKNLHILNTVVLGVSSVKKLEDCVDLPEQVLIDLPFDLYPDQVQDYNYAVKEHGLETPDGPLDFANGAVRVSKLLEICSGFYYSPPNKTACDTCFLEELSGTTQTPN
jgi:SNF2 family DNA or RNA helicase